MSLIFLVMMIIGQSSVDVVYLEQESVKECVTNAGTGYYTVDVQGDKREVYTSCVVGTIK